MNQIGNAGFDPPPSGCGITRKDRSLLVGVRRWQVGPRAKKKFQKWSGQNYGPVWCSLTAFVSVFIVD